MTDVRGGPRFDLSAALIAALLTLVAAPALAGPPMATLVSALGASFDECKPRAQQALAAEGLGGFLDYGNGWIASNSSQTAAVGCIHGGTSSTVVVHIAVATGGGDPVPLRDRLWQRMSGTAPVANTSHLKVEPGAGQVTFYWINTPGNAKDWISVKKVGAPDTDGSPPFQYLTGPNGNATWKLEPGQYEARLYYNDSYKVEERVVFTIP